VKWDTCRRYVLHPTYLFFLFPFFPPSRFTSTPLPDVSNLSVLFARWKRASLPSFPPFAQHKVSAYTAKNAVVLKKNKKSASCMARVRRGWRARAEGRRASLASAMNEGRREKKGVQVELVEPVNPRCVRVLEPFSPLRCKKRLAVKWVN